MAVLAVITRMRLYHDERFHREVLKLGCKLIRNSMAVVGVKNAQHQLKNTQPLAKFALTV